MSNGAPEPVLWVEFARDLSNTQSRVQNCTFVLSTTVNSHQTVNLLVKNRESQLWRSSQKYPLTGALSKDEIGGQCGVGGSMPVPDERR